MQAATPGVMTSPLLRLFAVSWWLVVAGSVGVAICGLLISWADYHSSREYAAYRADLEALAKLPRATVEPPKLEEAARAPLPMATVIPDDPVPPRLDLVCRWWRRRPAALAAAVHHRDRDPPDCDGPLALRPALVALAPARRGPVTG